MEPAVNAQGNIESEIIAFGKEIFSAIGENQPSTFNKDFWFGRIMEWSMKKQDFKINLFRLVDVLPVLSGSESIASHVKEYLGPSASEISKLMAWGLSPKPTSFRAALTSLAVKKSVHQMARNFIAGQSAKDSLSALRRLRKIGLAFTVDLLGEFCVSEVEALDYLNRYLDALETYGKAKKSLSAYGEIVKGHPADQSPNCISVKLTALYSQCSVMNFERSVEVLSQRLSTITRKAKEVGASLYVDAEDTSNNLIIYETFKRVFSSPEFRDFPYPGIVVQAYSKSSRATILDLLDCAKKRGSPIAVRLVKGAYWDHETTICAQNDWPSPLFAKKESSDWNYEQLSRVLLDHHQICLPAFGSHNVRSLSHAVCYAKSLGLSERDFELQMLFGMAEPIAKAYAQKGYLVRLYVPLGEMLPGMGYLVRRLLENTSNESFLRQTFFEAGEAEKLLKEPVFRG